MAKPGTLLLVALGGLLTSLGAPTLFNTGQAVLGGIETHPAASAPAERWIRLTDAQLRCETRRAADRAAYYDAVAGGETFLVRAPEELPCQGMVLEGGFGRDRLRAGEFKDRLGLEPPPVPEFRLFSVLTSQFQWGVVAISGLLTLAGLATIFLAGRRLLARPQ